MVEVFVDRGESAKTADRPAFLRMVGFCSDNRIDAAIVWKLDRFARNSYDHAVFQATLAKSGVEVLSVTEPLSDTPAGKLMQTMLAGIAQFDNDVRAERTRAGMKSVARRGGWTTTPPMGFKPAKCEGFPILDHHPVEGPIVKDLFTRIACRRLQVRHAPGWLSEKLGREIRRQTIHKLLRNPVYAGIVQNSLTEDNPVQAAFPGLVDDWTFIAVQEVLQDGKKSWSPAPAKKYPLKGLLECECGQTITASTSRGRSGKLYSYYHCKCGFRVAQEDLDEKFNRYLVDVSEECSVLLPLFKEIVLDVWQQVQAEQMIEVENAQLQLKKIEAKREKLLDLHLDGGIDTETYKRKMAELDTDRMFFKSHDHDSDMDLEDAEAALDLAEKLFADLPTLFDHVPASDKKRFVTSVFGGPITVTKDVQLLNLNKRGIVWTLGSNAVTEGVPAEKSRTTIISFIRAVNDVSDLLAA